MAKFAVLFLAAVAFQAVSAGVWMNQRFEESALGDYKYGLQYRGYPTGKFDSLFGELQTVSQDLTIYFQRALPNDRLVLKTLTWQCRELALYIDAIIEKLEAECYKCDGQVPMVLEEFCRELREIQMQYQQIAAYTSDVYAATPMKNQFYMNVQRTIVQLEKLVRFVQTDLEQTQGELYFMVKNVVADFLYAFRNIYTHVQYYGAYTEQSPMQLVSEIQEVTNYLTGYLQGLTHFDAQRMHAVREYVQHVETLFRKIQGIEGSYGNMEVSAAYQKIYSRLHRMHAYFMQMIDAEYMENVEVIRKQLIEELQFVCEAFEQFVQYAARGGNYQTFFYEILGDYLYAMQQFKMQMMHSEYQSNYYQGEYYGLQGFYKQGLYKNAGLWGKTAYQGLYRYGGYGYGLSGKYQGFAKYNQDLKQVDMQIQTIMRELYKRFQTISCDDMRVKQACMHMMREYAQQLEMIVERMHQYVSSKAGTETYMYEEICQNLRQYVMTLQKMCSMEMRMEMTNEFYMCCQKIAAEFEKLMFAMQKTDASCYYLVKDVLYQYLTATYDLCMHVQSMSEISYYGYLPYARQYYGGNYRMMENYPQNRLMENINNYGPYARQYRMMENINNYGRQYYGAEKMYESPRELVNQIQYVAADLSSAFQNGMSFNQKHAQVLTVQARHFAQIIKTVIDQLEAYQQTDAMIQQVCYKLREIQMKFQQLAAYNVFTNAEQLKTEFENCIQIACAQIEKLVMVAQEQVRGEFFYAMKDCLHRFLYGLQDICQQIKELAQYGEMNQYGWEKYGREYGYDKYARGLFGLDKYGKGYGYGMGYKNQMMYQNQMGYQSRMGMGYENQMPYGKLWASQYNQAAIRAY